MNSTFFNKTKYGIVWCNTYHRLDFKSFTQEMNDGRWCERSNGCAYQSDILFHSEDGTLTRVILKEMENDIDDDKDMKHYEIEIKAYKLLQQERRQRVIQNTLKEFNVSHAEHFI